MTPDLRQISGQISGWGLRPVVRSVVDHWSEPRSVVMTPDLRVRSVVGTPRSVLCGVEPLIWPLIWLRSGVMTTDLSLDQWSTTDLTTGLKADQVSWPLVWSANHWSDHWSENKTWGTLLIWGANHWSKSSDQWSKSDLNPMYYDDILRNFEIFGFMEDIMG